MSESPRFFAKPWVRILIVIAIFAPFSYDLKNAYNVVASAQLSLDGIVIFVGSLVAAASITGPVIIKIIREKSAVSRDSFFAECEPIRTRVMRSILFAR
jgi:hypothetical protein